MNAVIADDLREDYEALHKALRDIKSATLPNRDRNTPKTVADIVRSMDNAHALAKGVLDVATPPRDYFD